jgi:hypothetical protein
MTPLPRNYAAQAQAQAQAKYKISFTTLVAVKMVEDEN